MTTIKQKLAFNKVVENGGKVSTAMRDVGYSSATAKTPQKLTESKGWLELLEQFAPDDLLAEKLGDGLESTKPISALVLISGDKPMRTKDNEGQIEVPDYAIRHKYLETALKLKQKLTDKLDLTSKGEKIEGNQIVFSDFKNGTKS